MLGCPLDMLKVLGDSGEAITPDGQHLSPHAGHSAPPVCEERRILGPPSCCCHTAQPPMLQWQFDLKDAVSHSRPSSDIGCHLLE